MLILTRRVGERVMIGNEVTVAVMGVQGKRIRLGITAPKGVVIYREEIYQLMQHSVQSEDSTGVATTSELPPTSPVLPK